MKVKRILPVAALLIAMSTWGQTTNTTCTTTGNTTNCTSTTQPSPYQIGQQIGTAIGNGLNAAMDTPPTMNWRGIKKYCKKHRGESWQQTARNGQVVGTGQCRADGSVFADYWR
jgi:hypothetical protein